MPDLTVKENTAIVIKKNKGLTHALRDLVKENPNSILSDGKITAKEWNAVLDKLIDINNARKANNQKPIFTGGTDKSRAGWHSSFVVHPNQKIEFTPEEMSALYSAMGVTLKSIENSENATEQKVESNPDSTVVTQSEKQDTIPSLKTDPVPEKSKLDTSKVVSATQKDSVALPAAEHEKTVISADDSTDVKEAPVDTSSKKSRYELSWGEIGKISLKSAKNFVKGMFCDENGFSLKRTATTVGVVAGLALAAPVAAAAGASAAVVGGVALTAKVAGLGLAGVMVYNGSKNAIEGGKKYYNSTTEEEAKANMEQAMDGAVEAAAALPAFFAIKGGANKGNKIAKNKAESKPAPEVKPEPQAEAKPTPEVKPASEQMRSEYEFDFSVPEKKPAVEIKPEPEIKPVQEPKVPQNSQPAETPKSEPNVSNPAPKVEPKPAEEVKPAEAPKPDTKPNEAKPAEPVDYSTRIEIVRTKNGFKIERHRNADGMISRDVVFDKNGKYSYTKEIQYAADGTEAGYTVDWATGTKDVFKTGANQGVRTNADGTQWIIKKEGTKIVEVEQIKPNAETSAPEAKPAAEATTKIQSKTPEDAKSAEVQTSDKFPNFKELETYSESDLNVSVTSAGHGQTPGNTRQVPDLRNYLAKDGTWHDSAIVYLPNENATAIVMKISGRRGDNWTLMVNGKVPQAKAEAFIKYCSDNNVTRIDRTLFADFFNGKLN